MACEMKEPGAKEQFIEYSNPLIKKICEKWCEDVSGILKETAICQRNKQQMEAKFVNNLTAKWNGAIDEMWETYQFYAKLSDLGERKLKSAGHSSNAWRRFGHTPEEQTKSMRTSLMMSLVNETEVTVAKQGAALEHIICEVQHKRDLLQQCSKRREEIGRRIDLHIKISSQPFTDNLQDTQFPDVIEN